MTAEALAAIDGARQAGATQFVIADSHGNEQQNLLIEKFPNRRHDHSRQSAPARHDGRDRLDLRRRRFHRVSRSDDERAWRARAYHLECHSRVDSHQRAPNGGVWDERDDRLAISAFPVALISGDADAGRGAQGVGADGVEASSSEARDQLSRGERRCHRRRHRRSFARERRRRSTG